MGPDQPGEATSSGQFCRRDTPPQYRRLKHLQVASFSQVWGLNRGDSPEVAAPQGWAELAQTGQRGGFVPSHLG